MTLVDSGAGQRGEERLGSLGSLDGKQSKDASNISLFLPPTHSPTLEKYHQRHSGLNEAGEYQDAFWPQHVFDVHTRLSQFRPSHHYETTHVHGKSPS
jgi:hypothetical protein